MPAPRALRSSRASLGHVSDCADLRPCPLNPGGVSHWPGGSASGSSRGFHATPNERPRPHHSVRILLTFWPIGQPCQMHSARGPARGEACPGRRAACGGHQFAGTGSRDRATAEGRRRRCRDRSQAVPRPGTPRARRHGHETFPGDLVRSCGPQRPGGVSVDVRGQPWWCKKPEAFDTGP